MLGYDARMSDNPSKQEQEMERAVRLLLIAVENARLAGEIIGPHMNTVMAISGTAPKLSKANVVGMCAAAIVTKTMGSLAKAGIVQIQE